MEILEGNSIIVLLEKAAVICTFILTALLIWQSRTQTHHGDTETVEALRSILQLHAKLKLEVAEKIYESRGAITHEINKLEETISRSFNTLSNEHRELREENSEIRRDIERSK